jgi:hypothetical protein
MLLYKLVMLVDAAKKTLEKASIRSGHKTKQAGCRGSQADRADGPACFVLHPLLAPLFC